MSEKRDYLIIPDADELIAAKQEYDALIARRATRGEFTVDEQGQAKVRGFVNADQILARNAHLQVDITTRGAMLAVNIEAGRISPERVFELGANHILEMFAIATNAYLARQIEDEI